VFAPLLAGLSGGKMSASDQESGIWLTDDAATVREKVDDAYCPAGEVEDNGVLQYLEYLVFPVLGTREELPFTVERPEEYGGDLTYESYDPLEDDFLSGELHPADLKPAVGDAMAAVVGPVREHVLEHREVLADAYPEKYD
jgi:tyrosyl-tRNA synthetase